MPQPVDLQTELARMNAVDRVQQVADRVSLAAQQRGELAIEQERLKSETQVNQTEDAEQRGVDADGGQEPSQGRGKKKGRESEDEHSLKSPAHDGEEHHFDVQV